MNLTKWLRARRWLPVALGLSIALAAGLTLRAGAARAPAAQTVVAELGELKHTITATGPVQPSEQMTVAAGVGGLLTEVAFDVGDQVQAGDQLAVVDPGPLEAALREAEARVAQQEAQLAALRRRAELGDEQSRNRVIAAEQRLALAEATLVQQVEGARHQVLAAAEAVAAAERALQNHPNPGPDLFERLAEAERAAATARRELDRLEGRADPPAPARLQAELARTELAEARLAAELARVQPEEIAAAEAALAAARQGLAQAEANLARSVVTAPITGVVLERRVEAGHGVAAGTPLLVIGVLEPAIVAAKVDEAEVGRILPGQPVEITSTGLPGRTLTGRVRQVLPAAFPDGSATVVTAEVEFANPGLLLRPGMNADAVITVAQEADILSVPAAALAEGRYLWVVKADGRVERREVTAGLTTGSLTAITAGLQAGERVVIGPADLLASLQPGDPITLEEGR